MKPNTNKLICLDLYCGAGGCSVGYARAGFYVIGVDIKPQPSYPFTFIQADALTFEIPEWVDFIHASPPCNAHTVINHSKKNQVISLVSATRKKLSKTRLPYVIENTPRAPLKDGFMLCGTMFGLDVIRHRIFESNVMLLHGMQCDHRGNVADGTYVSVHGGGQRSTHKIPYAEQRARWEGAMDIDWMKTRGELVLAIPPAYTEFIGGQIIDYLKRAEAA